MAFGFKLPFRATLWCLTVCLAAGCAPTPYLPRETDRGPRTYERAERFAGATRRALVHLPPAWRPGARLPMVIALHGRFGSAKDFAARYRWVELADREGFIAVFPQSSLPMGLWNIRPGGLDDEGWLAWLTGRLIAETGADPGRVYLTGHSMGGMMAHRLAAAHPALFAAAGMVSSCVGVGVDGKPMLWPKPDRPVPVLLMHGRRDPTLPFEGGGGGRGFEFLPFEAGVEYWTSACGCAGSPMVEAAGGVERRVWRGCAQGAEVESVVLAEGGHEWPGAIPARGRERDADGLDATAELWRFFKGHARP